MTGVLTTLLGVLLTKQRGLLIKPPGIWPIRQSKLPTGLSTIQLIKRSGLLILKLIRKKRLPVALRIEQHIRNR
jgi:hypothetical protein